MGEGLWSRRQNPELLRSRSSWLLRFGLRVRSLYRARRNPARSANFSRANFRRISANFVIWTKEVDREQKKKIHLAYIVYFISLIYLSIILVGQINYFFFLQMLELNIDRASKAWNPLFRELRGSRLIPMRILMYSGYYSNINLAAAIGEWTWRPARTLLVSRDTQRRGFYAACARSVNG